MCYHLGNFLFIFDNAGWGDERGGGWVPVSHALAILPTIPVAVWWSQNIPAKRFFPIKFDFTPSTKGSEQVHEQGLRLGHVVPFPPSQISTNPSWKSSIQRYEHVRHMLLIVWSTIVNMYSYIISKTCPPIQTSNRAFNPTSPTLGTYYPCCHLLEADYEDIFWWDIRHMSTIQMLVVPVDYIMSYGHARHVTVKGLRLGR